MNEELLKAVQEARAIMDAAHVPEPSHVFITSVQANKMSEAFGVSVEELRKNKRFVIMDELPMLDE